jgi:hypothetical protein
MKIEKKQEQELASREGNATTTIINGAWLLLSLVAAFFIFRYLDQSGILTVRAIRAGVHLPRYIPDWAITGLGMLIFVMLSQFALTLGFFFASPQGRRKAGAGDMYTTNRDLNDRG